MFIEQAFQKTEKSGRKTANSRGFRRAVDIIFSCNSMEDYVY